MEGKSVVEFLQSSAEQGGLQTDDLISCFVPLLKQVADLHENGLVAPLNDLSKIKVSRDILWFENAHSAQPQSNYSEIKKLLAPWQFSAFTISGNDKVEFDADGSITESEQKKIPRHLDQYRSWEIEYCDHHDALTDIYLLGMLLASFSLNLNFTDEEDLQVFKLNSTSLQNINERLHPVIGRTIREMTCLNRHERTQDLKLIINRLIHYREQDINSEEEILEGIEEKAPKRDSLILNRLRKRLYDFSRRNKLIFFKETQQALNLTSGSVPLMLNYQQLRPEHLLIWNTKIAAAVKSGGKFNLSDFLQYNDQPWLKKSLMSIRAASNRCLKEYGFSQLQIVVSFLHWHNLKENKNERIKSPLLLLPVKLIRKKGVRDAWIVDFQNSEAVINPALREYLYEIYGLKLPETFDLSKNTPHDLYKTVTAAITASEPSVTVNLLEKPRIKLLQSTAKKKLAAYRKRSANRARRRNDAKKDYSYDPDNYNPLGLQLYQHYVKPEPLPFRNIVGNEEDVRPQQLDGEKGLYHKDEAPADPYFWEFDLCSVTLGNFNYRKMTLVRDYNGIIEDDISSESFEKVFSTEPLKELPPADELEDFSTRYHILPADPTQMAAVDHANKRLSYIIQGPPGTGKSQTITNLIADYAARDKRVLFVCEKRAAIDVVYHRLSECGLEDLCCLIHDSQEDKKSFIMDLKECYHNLSSDPDPEIEEKRAAVCSELTSVIRPVREFLEHQNSKTASGATLDELIQRLISLEKHQLSLDKVEADRLPNLKDFAENKLPIKQFYETLKVQTDARVFNKSPYSIVNGKILDSDSPAADLSDLLKTCIELLQSFLENFPEPFSADEISLTDLYDVMKIAAEVDHWEKRQLLFMADTSNSTCQQVTRDFSRLTRQINKLEDLKEKNKYWKDKLNKDETQWASQIAKNTEKSFIKFLKPSWWKLRKTLNECYDFSQHRFKPVWSQVLDSLNEEHETIEKCEEITEELCSTYNFKDIDTDRAGIEDFRNLLRKNDIEADSLEKNIDIWQKLSQHAADFNKIQESFDSLLVINDELGARNILNKLCSLNDLIEDFDKYLPVIEDFEKLPDKFKQIIRENPYNWENIEYAVCEKTFNSYIAAHRDYKRFDFNKIRTLQKKYSSLLNKLYKLNAAAIKDKKSSRFSKHLKICNSPASQLTGEQKEFKKDYNRGRKELEHEFSKKMRYKSIRDLSSGDSGKVLKDLKPIWLMSPLSVSDTLPLDDNEFDVVIFDEASQILIEEAVPTLYRSKQFIVVGDEMQLPPTTFFSTSKDEEEEEDEVYLDVNCDSFLTLAAKSLPSTLLGWHYRSRNELLISFSNASFYENSLLTVPEKSRVTKTLNQIEAEYPLDGEANYPFIIDRPISFHLMKNGVYENRRNSSEADYIAGLVKSYLLSDSKLSLGIVAFSEAQQSEIESSIDSLAEEDDTFARLYQSAVDREDDGQFNGIFVKNLENVQGDERDIMLLSICYAPDSVGKMRMNFGPINQSGGEKRLNVIFTRAKRHVAVISTIRANKITNDYNDGARCLKNYLKYAEAISCGDRDTAASVISSICLERINDEASNELLPQYQYLKNNLNSYTSELNIGTSEFKAPLAVGVKETEQSFNLALLDLSGSKVNASLEMGFIRPALLQAFGWSVITTTAKDIFLSDEKVLELITESLQKPES